MIFRTSVSPYAQQRPTWHHGHQTAEMEGGFCFESTIHVIIRLWLGKNGYQIMHRMLSDNRIISKLREWGLLGNDGMVRSKAFVNKYKQL